MNIFCWNLSSIRDHSGDCLTQLKTMIAVVWSTIHWRSLAIPLGPRKGSPDGGAGCLGPLAAGRQAPSLALKLPRHQNSTTQPGTASRGVPSCAWGSSWAELERSRVGSPSCLLGTGPIQEPTIFWMGALNWGHAENGSLFWDHATWPWNVVICFASLTWVPDHRRLLWSFLELVLEKQSIVLYSWAAWHNPRSSCHFLVAASKITPYSPGMEQPALPSLIQAPETFERWRGRCVGGGGWWSGT